MFLHVSSASGEFGMSHVPESNVGPQEGSTSADTIATVRAAVLSARRDEQNIVMIGIMKPNKSQTNRHSNFKVSVLNWKRNAKPNRNSKICVFILYYPPIEFASKSRLANPDRVGRGQAHRAGLRKRAAPAPTWPNLDCLQQLGTEFTARPSSLDSGGVSFWKGFWYFGGAGGGLQVSPGGLAQENFSWARCVGGYLAETPGQ